MNIQAMVDAMNMSDQMERARYHLTLGKLIEKLQTLPQEANVWIDATGLSVADLDSYRGHYCDLALETSKAPMTVEALAGLAIGALGEVFQGYKGGNYRMTCDTPLWVSDYGVSSGLAVMDIELVNGDAVIRTRVIE